MSHAFGEHPAQHPLAAHGTCSQRYPPQRVLPTTLLELAGRPAGRLLGLRRQQATLTSTDSLAAQTEVGRIPALAI